MLQDALGHIWKPLGRTSWYPSILFTSAVIVSRVGKFPVARNQGSLGGINSLRPLFGICNQLLATVALCVATAIIVKMGRVRYVLVTLIRCAGWWPVTFTAWWHKVLDPNPTYRFLATARQLAAAGANPRLIFNDRLDAAVTGVLVVMVAMI